MQALGTASLNETLWQPAAARTGQAAGSASDRGSWVHDDRPDRLSTPDCPDRPGDATEDTPAREPASTARRRDSVDEPPASRRSRDETTGGALRRDETPADPAGPAPDGSAETVEIARNGKNNGVSDRSSAVSGRKPASGATEKPQADPKTVGSRPKTGTFAAAIAAQLASSSSKTAVTARQNGTKASVRPSTAHPASVPGLKRAPTTPVADAKAGQAAATAASGKGEKQAGQTLVVASAAKSASQIATATAAKADASNRMPLTNGQAKSSPAVAPDAGQKPLAPAAAQASEKVLTTRSVHAKAVSAAESARPDGVKTAGQAGKADAQRVRTAEAAASGQQKKPATAGDKAGRTGGEPATARPSTGQAASPKPQPEATPAVESRGEAVAAVHGAASSDVASTARLAAARPAEAGNMDRGPGDVAGQVAESIRASGSPTDRQILVNLNPPELGQVRIVLRTEADGIHGVIRAEEAATLSKLQQEAAPLVARLSADGIEIRRLDFGLTEQQSGHQADTGAAFRDGQAEADAWAGEHGPRSGGSGDASGAASGGSEGAAEADGGAAGAVWNAVGGSVNVQV